MKTLKTQILAYLVVPTFIVILIIVAIIAFISKQITEQQVTDKLVLQVTSSASEIDKLNALAGRTSNLLALVQEQRKLGERELSLDIAKRVLQEFPEFNGVYYGYEANADSLDNRYIDATYTAQQGRFLPYWHRDGNNPIVLEPLVDMESSLYYDGVKQVYQSTGKAEVMTTEPYLYQGKMLVEYSFPIVLQNQFYGVAGVDKALDNLAEYLNKTKSKTNTDFFLLSNNHNFIASTFNNNQLRTKALKNTQYSTLFNQLHNGDVILAEDPFTKDDYYYAAAKVSAGNWLLVARQSKEIVLAPINSLLTNIIIISVISMLLLAGISLWFVKGISQRIVNAVQLAEKVANGDVKNISLNQASDDEIGQMERSLAKVINLYIEIAAACSKIAQGDFNVVMAFRGEQDDVANAINQMVSRRREVDSELREHNQIISNSSEKQKSEIESVATSTHQLSLTVNEVSKLATVSADKSSTIATSAHESRENLLQAVDDMQTLATEVLSVRDAISQVAQSSENISNIVDVINMIAEQTNLLALNAAIEAARAGEQGRGFAVVADEVRSLASKTRSSTEEINELISKLGIGVKSAVTKVESSVDSANKTVEQSQEAAEKLSEIVATIDGISGDMTQVAAAVEQQSVTCEDINQNIKTLHDEAQELSNLASNNG